MRIGTLRVVVGVIVLALVLGSAALAVGLLAGPSDDSDDSGDSGDSGRSSSSSAGTAGPAPTTTPAADATTPPDPALATYYSQRLDWSACPSDDSQECATLTVPLDYQDPTAGDIDLALLKVPAQDAAGRIGSLVVNPGGPGGSGTEYAAAATSVFREPLLQRYDIVGFDPRGTGRSTAVDCLSDDQLDDYVATDPDPDTAAEESTYEGWTTALGEGCLARSGALAAHVTTIEAARDMDVLRAALGESTLTYFGASYGTKLGATYADLFPTRAGRLVLDGAVDLSISSREASLEQAAGFETALRSYVQNCLDTTDSCFLGDTVEEALTTITDFLADVDDQPLPTGDGRELEVGNAFYGIVAPLYNREYWSILSQALRSGLSGDGSTLMLLSDAYTGSDGRGGFLDNRSEAIYAINCLDDPYAITGAEVPAQYADFERASPTFGRVFAWGLTTCGGIEVTSTEPARQVTGAGAPPIVVVGTTRDPATPYQWAVNLAAQLQSGVLVSRDGDGHTGYNSGNDCVDEAVEGYLLDGTVPEDGLSC